MGHLLIRQVPADGDVSMLTDAEEKLLFRFQIHEFLQLDQSGVMDMTHNL